MSRHKTKNRILASDINALVEEATCRMPEEELLRKNDTKGSLNNIADILNQSPIYSENNNIDEMAERNKGFYEETSKKIFNSIHKEEQKKLDELLNTKYYPEERTEEVDNLTLVKTNLNLIR
jgi:flagellar motor switch protein FliG